MLGRHTSYYWASDLSRGVQVAGSPEDSEIDSDNAFHEIDAALQMGDVDSGLSAIDGINNDEVCTPHGFRVLCSMPTPVGARLRALLPLPCLTLRFCPG